MNPAPSAPSSQKQVRVRGQIARGHLITSVIVGVEEKRRSGQEHSSPGPVRRARDTAMIESSSTGKLQQTPLHALHKRLGAKLVPFAGYEMPLQYRGIVAEHLHAREKAVLFDVSHMGQVRVSGENVSETLERVVPADVTELAGSNMRYTLLTNDQGGIRDDLMITQGGYYVDLVVNASRKHDDVAYLQERLSGDCDVVLRTELALLALQGPAAAAVLSRHAPAARLMLFMTSELLSIGNIRAIVSRSGYTGEDGFEISVAAEEAEELAEILLAEPEVKPAGLGARDTLRLEAGLCLYGNDIDETTTPVEAGLGWTIGRRRRKEGGFPGAELVLAQLRETPLRRRVGIRFEGRTPVRAGTPLLNREGAPIGMITSGTWSPSLNAPIALSYIASSSNQLGAPVTALVRDRPIPGQVSALPFVPHRYARP